MNKKILSAVFGAGAGLVLAAIWVTYWQSEPQQIKRACQIQTWNHLVAPSTAKLLGFELSSQATVPHQAFESEVNDLQAKIAANKKSQDEIHTAQKDAEDAVKTAMAKKGLNGDDKTQILNAAFNAQMKLFNTVAPLIGDEIRLEGELKGAQQRLHAFDAKDLSQVVLTFDTQYRASALLRMQSVCTYHQEKDASHTAATVLFYKAAESGNLQ
ncbi:MAG: hypothetical protein KGK05_09840 [Xanthomonadaceae bacterium]|nr:hypothetical protein [Xanthomonadaceae bacterium]